MVSPRLAVEKTKRLGIVLRRVVLGGVDAPLLAHETACASNAFIG